MRPLCRYYGEAPTLMLSPDHPSHHFSQPACVMAIRPSRDVLWDRLIFRAPSLFNLRLIFDPPPFRTQGFTDRRPGRNSR